MQNIPFYLDDEDQANEDANILHNDESKTSNNDGNESDADDGNLSEDEEEERIVEYDSEENEIEVRSIIVPRTRCYYNEIFLCCKGSSCSKKENRRLFRR